MLACIHNKDYNINYAQPLVPETTAARISFRCNLFMHF